MVDRSGSSRRQARGEVLLQAKQKIPSLADDIQSSGIYREPLLALPTDDIQRDDGTTVPFTPSSFNGPKDTARRFHAFPRFGYTNDITSLVVFGDADDGGSRIGGGIIDGQGGFLSKLNDTAAAGDVGVDSLMEREIPTLSNVEYKSEDATDYIRGIAAAGILVVAIYLVWGTCLLLLRAGRMDCCFRLCKGCGRSCRRKKTGRAKSLSSSMDMDDDHDHEDAAGAECCCYTCHESLAAKGGCCARHVFCGWMAGRAPKMPTKESLMKEKKLKETSLMKKSGVVQSVTRSVMARASSGDGGEDDVAEAETGVAAVEGTKTVDDDEEVATVLIDDDYLLQRQTSARRTMLALRIVFLLASSATLASSITLLVKGWQGVNGVVDGTKETIQVVESQLGTMMDGIEQYLEQNEEMKAKRMQFLDETTAQLNEVGTNGTQSGKVGWCPASAGGADGTVDVTVSLGRLLLRGNLIKLAFVEDAADAATEVAGNAKDQVVATVQDGAEADVAAAATSSVQERGLTVVTFLDDLPIDGILGKVLGLKDLVDGNGLDGNGRIALLVARLKEMVKTLVSRVSGAVDSDEEGPDPQRLLQGAALASLKESQVVKNGVNYTVLTLVDDGIDQATDLIRDRLVFRDYNLTKLLTTNLTITLDIPALTGTINEQLNSTSSFFLDIFSRLYTGIEKVHAQSQSAQDSLDSILPYYYVAVVFICFVILLTCLFMIGTILAWTGKQHRLYRCTQDHILCPIFILCNLFVWIFTTVFLSLGVVSGDFCFNSPDFQVNQILEQTLRGTSQIGFNFAYYYVNGCPKEYQPKLMSVAFDALVLARTGIGQFFALVSSFGSGPLSRACGLETESTMNSLEALAGVVREHLASASDAVLSLAGLLLCQSISPLYTSLTYDLVCTDFLNLVAPMLWAMFIISICSMIMITTRVAWYELVEDEAGEDLLLMDHEKDDEEDSPALVEGSKPQDMPDTEIQTSNGRETE